MGWNFSKIMPFDVIAENALFLWNFNTQGNFLFIFTKIISCDDQWKVALSPKNIKQLGNLMFQLLATYFNSTWTRISSSCRLKLSYYDGLVMLYSSLSMLGFVSRLSPDLDFWLCLWHHTLCDLQADLDLQLDNPFLTVLCETGSFSYPYKLNK